eukprot:gnl/MRDRNA2_/MRDRNA2_59309_c0_seq2.p1 gnl/MRDRNA2_/MRDRNA2_59309_c0~~gnl/MRDRNA2_/MRDRNA2_59309_c0_seq2.p1  ORF type:complete len:101 (+),score=12.02 gnl/MRDRNA2_/MRDRNA2_59309_c0_seq2:272-574(+)
MTSSIPDDVALYVGAYSVLSLDPSHAVMGKLSSVMNRRGKAILIAGQEFAGFRVKGYYCAGCIVVHNPLPTATPGQSASAIKVVMITMLWISNIRQMRIV